MKKAYYILYVLRRWWSAGVNQNMASIRLSCQMILYKKRPLWQTSTITVPAVLDEFRNIVKKES